MSLSPEGTFALLNATLVYHLLRLRRAVYFISKYLIINHKDFSSNLYCNTGLLPDFYRKLAGAIHS